MTDETSSTGAPAEAAAPARKFSYNGMDLPDPDPSMTPAQVAELWAGTYPELANAKVKGPTKDSSGASVYTFARNVGHLG